MKNKKSKNKKSKYIVVDFNNVTVDEYNSLDAAQAAILSLVDGEEGRDEYNSVAEGEVHLYEIVRNIPISVSFERKAILHTN